MIIDFIQGASEFLGTVAFVLVIMELSFLAEEFFKTRFEIRRGFSGTGTSILEILKRHLLKILRIEGIWKDHVAFGLRAVPFFIAVGLLPIWSYRPGIENAYSFWIFGGIMVSTPLLSMICQWSSNKGAGWPFNLISAERALGGATALFILQITLVALTGEDTFEGFSHIQQHAWLIVQAPLSILLLIGFVTVAFFASFQTVFSKSHRFDKKDGWGFDDFFPSLNRVVWIIFVANIFLGGAPDFFGVGGFVLILKCVIVNVVAGIFSQIYFSFREDQAENFILWSLTPATIGTLIFSLILPGHRT